MPETNNHSRMANARRVIESDTLRNGPGPIATTMGYFTLGEPERGLEWLPEGLHARDQVTSCKGHPQFDIVRPDPRYQALVARLKVPDAK